MTSLEVLEMETMELSELDSLVFKVMANYFFLSVIKIMSGGNQKAPCKQIV